MGVGRLLVILWEWTTACTLLSVPDCLWWAQSAFSPALVKFLPPPLFSTHCVGMCSISPREEGATQPVFSFTSLLGPLWIDGFVLLPSVPVPCPFFSLLHSSFEIIHVHKIIGMDGNGLFLQQTKCFALLSCGQGWEQVLLLWLDRKHRVRFFVSVLCKQIQILIKFPFLVDPFERLKAQCRLLPSRVITKDTSFLSSPSC